jgi:hypothetical protein
MGIFGRKKQVSDRFSYHSHSAQADAARELCDLLNTGGRRMPMKARQRGPGYHFKYWDHNGFEHSLRIDENDRAVPVADMHGGGGHRGGDFQGLGGVNPRQIMAMQRDQFQHPGQMHMMPAQMQPGIQQRRPWDMQQAQQVAEHQQRARRHSQPHAQPLPQLQRAGARDSNRPIFQNPFKSPLPQGSYGKREYVPGQEKIKVSDYGPRADNPGTGWDLMQSLNQLRKQNGRG